MPTKVDRTASMLCRAHGCSLEATMDRLLDAEKRVAELEAAISEHHRVKLQRAAGPADKALWLCLKGK